MRQGALMKKEVRSRTESKNKRYHEWTEYNTQKNLHKKIKEVTTVVTYCRRYLIYQLFINNLLTHYLQEMVKKIMTTIKHIIRLSRERHNLSIVNSDTMFI